jgi:hypothetical protein
MHRQSSIMSPNRDRATGGSVTASTYTVVLDGGVLRRGFWLYVWEVTPPDGDRLVYVGRTGDSSSPNAQSPFNRMGQHLGFAATSSMLRKHLTSRRVDPINCTFRMVSHGPILEEVDNMADHKLLRDQIAAMERELAADLSSAGYDVLNKVQSRASLDEDAYADVRAAFAGEFPGL